ncbi:FadR/GntR family transcriptional regulator [Rhodococcus sp. NPDC057014]|uniref:FadR/GntR family transcriptional regulator n=1 Tax=Rhodococcus sp. NPDC057014 TaxID=3346000 RepID=UPI0036311C12
MSQQQGESGDTASERRLPIGQKVMRPRQQVEEQIAQWILSGQLVGGERLPTESELTRQFGVSRNTVREALRSLVTRGLITKVPGAGGGSFVRNVDTRSLGRSVSDSLQNLLSLGRIDFEELSLVRQHLEVPAVRGAAANRSDGDLERLVEIMERQRAAAVDDPQVPELDVQFHSAIADASGNRVLASFIAALHQHTEPVRYLDMSPEVGRMGVRQHQAIVDAITDRDADAGEKAIVDHLSYLREHIMAHRELGLGDGGR